MSIIDYANELEKEHGKEKAIEILKHKLNGINAGINAGLPKNLLLAKAVVIEAQIRHLESIEKINLMEEKHLVSLFSTFLKREIIKESFLESLVGTPVEGQPLSLDKVRELATLAAHYRGTSLKIKKHLLDAIEYYMDFTEQKLDAREVTLHMVTCKEETLHSGKVYEHTCNILVQGQLLGTAVFIRKYGQLIYTLTVVKCIDKTFWSHTQF